MLKIADVIVDLSRKDSSLIDRLRNRCGLNVLPLRPETNPNESRERNNGGEHQPQ